jgi:predicted nucleic acid-binding protein
VYLDAAPVIYLIEQHATFGPRTAAWLAANATALVSSELARLEALVVPVRSGDIARVQDIEAFFAGRVDEMVPFTRAVYDRAVDIRAAYRLKTLDALHAAAAVEAGCDVILTNDPDLARYPGVRVERI